MSKHVFPLILDGAVQPLSSVGSWNGLTSYVTAAGAGGAFTITLGDAEHAGTIVTVIKTDATNAVTVDPTTDFDSGSVASIALESANESCTFIWTGESWRMFTQDQTNSTAFTGGTVANATTFSSTVEVEGNVGFYNTTPVAQPTVAVAGTDAATTQTLANDLRDALIALGLVAAA